ncbi:hypothetical protein [Clostridium tyrobutyricum]|jgi:hypothetical protein|nr:hypothetical protein [Clostridium tyrobutyricum]
MVLDFFIKIIVTIGMLALFIFPFAHMGKRIDQNNESSQLLSTKVESM